MRKVLPWLTNVTLYSGLYAGGDLIIQHVTHKGDGELDWKRTRNVALVALCYHGNWNYFWLRALERRFPGRSIGRVLTKVALDQGFSSPLAISVFYTGLSLLEGKEDVFENWREKFLKTYKFLNFMFIPVPLRTVFMGCSAFVWAGFLCFSHKTGDGTFSSALTWILSAESRRINVEK
ncbi:Mpv17-like protein [Bagarius yarrelli]|uniref:Mpv17-like protein n=1 Tax=Bagarius yarrelli TaxID=175774 RepID=A0A556UZH2_BAGYA|nr:Mpv17-like protein [Bagarius yarrelli]